jgi:hypothetical protein
MVVIACAGFVGGCSSASSTTAGSSGGSSGSSSGSSSGGSAGCNGVVLTVKDVPVSSPKCLISMSGGTAAGYGARTACVPTGVITLSATPLSGFALDPMGTWHGTDGDTGSGDKGTISNNTSSTTVTVKTPGTKCVWACCPGMTSGMSPCPNTDQCQ